MNNKDECRANENGPVCQYSDYVRVTYYGGTDKTVKESKCGLRAVRNILSTGSKLVDEAIGFGASKIYGEMITKFKRMGYREGFSMGQFHRTTVYSQRRINSTLSTLMKMDKSITSKIKKFIAVAPPFAGADELLDVFLYGMHNFDFEIKIGKKEIFKVNYDVFGQNMIYKAMPILAELRPQSYINQLFASEKYKEFGKAILERIDLETECEDKNCDADYVKSHSVLFNAIFGEDTFPDLSDDVCKIETSFFKFLGSEAKLRDQENKDPMVILPSIVGHIWTRKVFVLLF